MDNNLNLDALALEYKGDYGTACRNVDVADLVNDPTANGVCRVFGLGSSKQLSELIPGQVRVLLDNGTYSLLIGKDAV